MDNRELLYAYVLGCLDVEERESLYESLKQEQVFDAQELGEYQNLTALLPAILALETPPPHLKDKVAKRLYKVQEELKAEMEAAAAAKEEERIKLQEAESLPVNSETEEEEQSAPVLNEEEEKFVVDLLNDEPGDKGTTKGIIEAEAPVEENVIDLTKDIPQGEEPPAKKYYTGANEPAKKGYGWMVMAFLLFFILVIALVFAYIRLNSDIKESQQEVERLSDRIKSMHMQTSGNREIQQLLSSASVKIINLKGTSLNPSGYGKIIFDPDNSRGYLQLAQMPSLPDGSFYQLWVNVSGSYMKLGSYKPHQTMEYFPLNLPRLPQDYSMYFSVTEEKEGAEKPGKKIFLMGNI